MTYSAFYIKPEKNALKKPSAVATQGIKGQIENAYKNAKNTLQNFDIKQMAKNINLQNISAFTQKYGVAALTTIINQRPVTNQMMLDSLFNGIAPALGITAGQLGFNSLMEMKNAVQAANINVANFMQGLSNGLSIVADTKDGQADYSKYGEEIPIDLTQQFGENHTMETPDRRVQNGQTYNEYYHVLPLVLNFSGVIKDNKNFTAHEFADKLKDLADSLKPFTFRAGEKVYENYVFTSFNPVRETENGITFDCEIKFIQGGDVEYVKVNIPKKAASAITNAAKKTAKIVKNSSKGQATGNKTAPVQYEGLTANVYKILTGQDATRPPWVQNYIDKMAGWRN